MQTHETIVSFRKVAAGSDRKFGLTLGIVLAALALWPLLRHHSPRIWLLAIGIILFAGGLFFPAALGPFNRAWFRLGLFLNRLVGPVVMGLLFFGAVVPVGWVLRLRGEDPLKLKRDPDAATYWTRREPPGPRPGTLMKQY
ncbi:MAG TPA: SxtJ family membrane protein [Methylovirgula sp.]|nr:SxtJ family membrane protein [Methylovirgula sp.]